MYLHSLLVSFFAALSAALPAAEPQDELAAPASAGNTVRPAWATIDSKSMFFRLKGFTRNQLTC